MKRIKIASQLMTGVIINKGILFIREHKEEFVTHVLEITDELIKQGEHKEESFEKIICLDCELFEGCCYCESGEAIECTAFEPKESNK